MLIDQDPVYIPVAPGIVDFIRVYAGGDAVVSYNIRGKRLAVELFAQVSPRVWDAIWEPEEDVEVDFAGDDDDDDDDLDGIPR